MKERQVLSMGASYNIGARYEIIGRITQGTTVVAYMINDRTNNSKSKLEKCIIEQLALNKQIYNCTAQVYENIVNLKGINCKLSKLPKYTEDGKIIEDVDKPKKKVVPDLKIVGKVQSGRSIVAYVIAPLNDSSKLMKLSKDNVLQLAQDGRLSNAKVQMNNGDIMLRGASGFNLSQLVAYR